jgi:hypothetical protein
MKLSKAAEHLAISNALFYLGSKPCPMYPGDPDRDPEWEAESARLLGEAWQIRPPLDVQVRVLRALRDAGRLGEDTRRAAREAQERRFGQVHVEALRALGPGWRELGYATI